MRRLARRGYGWVWVGVALAGVCAWAFERVVVEGQSMLPTFAPGDRLLLVRRARRLRVGDVVAVADPRLASRRLVKRVSAITGGDVELAGDNPAASTDSRTFGSVRVTDVRHLVVRRYASARP